MERPDEDSLIVATTDVERTLAAPIEVDAAELEADRRDAEWREFCLEAERYARATTRESVDHRWAA